MIVRIKKWRSLLFLWCFFAAMLDASPAAQSNAEKLEKISAQLQLKPFLQGDFVQERKLKGFDRTLVSHGQYYFWRQHGLYWEIQKPFYRASTFGNKATISWSAPGTISSSSPPKMIQKQISKVLIAVLGTDFETLQKYFVAEAHIEEGDKFSWRMQLQPKDLVTGKVLKQLDLVGDSSLREISVTSANGGVTKISFSTAQMFDKPSESQCQRFYPHANMCP